MNDRKGCLLASFIFVTLLGIMGLCGVLTVLLYRASTTPHREQYVSGTFQKKLVLIDIKGEISNQNGSFSLFSGSVASAPGIISQIQNAIDDENAVGILIEMDTPGGEIVASDLIYQKLLEAKSHGVKVVTYMQTLGASGGYYIAAASDTILANELTTTGSIGVYAQFQDLSGLYQKLGIRQRTITHGDFKTGEGLFDADNEGEEDLIYQKLVDESYDRFVSIISTGRGLTNEEVRKLSDGRIFSGKQALENGLIDQIGGYNEAYWETQDLTGIIDLSVVRYSNSDFWSMLFGIFKNFNVDAFLYNLAKHEQAMKLMAKMK